MTRSGFTLAELLIALVILGVIATFTIPKVLQGQADSKRTAILKEDFAALNSADYVGTLQGDITQTTYIAYLQQHINAVKVCSNSSTGGCWPGGATAPDNTATAAGFLMHNGSMINDIEASNPIADIIWIDWNGADGPNQNCDDQIPFVIALGSGSYDAKIVQTGVVYPLTTALFPGSLAADRCPDQTYDDLFRN